MFTRTIEPAACTEQCDDTDHDGDGDAYNGFDTPNTTCDDGNPMTTNDTVNDMCVCM